MSCARCSFRQTLVCLLALLLLCPAARAGRILTHFRFVKIDNAAQIDQEGKYILLAEYNGMDYLLKAQAAYDDKKIAAHIVSLSSYGLTTTPDTLPVPPTDCIWQFRPAGDSLWYAVSIDRGLTFIQGEKDSSDIALTANLRSKDIIKWKITEENGLFKLKNGERRLSYNEGYDFFGFYKRIGGIRDLYIYRAVCDTTEIDTSAALTGAAFAYTVPSTTGTQALRWQDDRTQKAVDVSDYVLRDHTLATDAPASRLSIEDNGLTADGSRIIKSTHGGRWASCAGIPILIEGNSIQALCCDMRQGNPFVWMPTDSVDGLIYRYASAMPYGEEAASVFDRHTLTLHGGWSKPALNRLNLRPAVTGVDLTACVLPTSVPQIPVAHANRAIYVSESDTALLDTAQQNVVSCNADGNTLTTALGLTDALPFCFDRDIRVPRDGQVSYSRIMPDNHWQTLYLPFSINEEMTDMAFAAIESVEPESVKLSSITKAEAYTPLLFRYRGVAGRVLTFSGGAQTIHATPQTAAEPFQGLNDTLNIALGTNCLALNATGTAFVAALSGSTIAPFRAMLYVSSSSPKYIGWPTDGIRSAFRTESDGRLYDLEGRRLSPKATGLKPLLIIKNRHLYHAINP